MESNIINLYQSGLSASKISKIIPLSQYKILSILKKNNIKIRKHRKYLINEDFFNNIDTPEKAYWLGFLMADGYNSGKYIRIDIQDKGHLEKLRNLIFINNDMPIRTKNNKTNNKIIYYLTFQSPILTKNLESFGIVQRKSLVSKYPHINNNLDSHFIRGIFDGDGSISKSKQSKNYYKYQFSIVGNYEIIQSIRNIIVRNTNVNIGIGDCRNIKRLYICGNQQIGKVLNWIYSDASVFLDRKFLKYQDLIIYNSRSLKYH